MHKISLLFLLLFTTSCRAQVKSQKETIEAVKDSVLSCDPDKPNDSIIAPGGERSFSYDYESRRLSVDRYIQTREPGITIAFPYFPMCQRNTNPKDSHKGHWVEDSAKKKAYLDKMTYYSNLVTDVFKRVLSEKELQDFIEQGPSLFRRQTEKDNDDKFITALKAQVELRKLQKP